MLSGVSIKIRVAGGNVKVGSGRYLRDAHAKRHSRYNAALPQRFGGGCREGVRNRPTVGIFFNFRCSEIHTTTSTYVSLIFIQ